MATLRIYFVEAAASQQGVIARALRERFPVDPPATTWVLVDGLSKPEWLIEIEAEAVLPEIGWAPRAILAMARPSAEHRQSPGRVNAYPKWVYDVSGSCRFSAGGAGCETGAGP